MLTPPYHFSIVAAPITQDDDGAGTSRLRPQHILYRGSLPRARNASFIRRLGIRTLVYLRKKPLKDDEPLVGWAAKRAIDLQWVQADKMTEEALGMESEQVGDVLKILLNPAAYPIYLADNDGISHTTLVVACLRKLQGWHADSIVSEIYRFEPDHDDLPLVSFITSYLSMSAPSKDDAGGALALPPPPYPAWLWQPGGGLGGSGGGGARTTPPAGSGRGEQRERERDRDRGDRERERDRAASTASNASSATAGGALPFPNPLMARRHPSMRLGFGNVPNPSAADARAAARDAAREAAAAGAKDRDGLWRARSNTVASRVATAASERARPASPRDTLNSRTSSGLVPADEPGAAGTGTGVDGGAAAAGNAADMPQLRHKVSFHENVLPSSVLTRSPVAGGRPRFSDDKASLSGSALDDDAPDEPDEYAVDADVPLEDGYKADGGGFEDGHGDEQEEEEDEDEDEEEEEEDDEDEDEDEDDEPPVSQYISALDLAGL